MSAESETVFAKAQRYVGARVIFKSGGGGGGGRDDNIVLFPGGNSWSVRARWDPADGSERGDRQRGAVTYVTARVCV